jgi:hypothetical protein
MNEVGEAQMSKTQQAVMAVLSLAVVMVFGCLGTCVLVYLRDGSAALSPAATDQAQGVSAASDAPVSPPNASDYGYRLCFQDVSATHQSLIEDFGLVTSIAMGDSEAVCRTAVGLDLEGRASELKALHEGCPDPSAENLRAARRFVDSSLTEITEAALLIQRYCSEGQNASSLEEAMNHVGEAGLLWAQGDREMEAYYESY